MPVRFTLSPFVPGRRNLVHIFRPLETPARTWGFSTAIWAVEGSQVSDQAAQSGEEPLVLGVGAEGDADVAGAAERGAGANQHLALLAAADDLGLVGFGEVDPGEVGLACGDHKARLAQRLLDEDALDDRLLDPSHDVVLVQDCLRPGGLRDRIDAERLPHRIDRLAELRRADRVADPNSGQSVALAERP